LYQNPHVKSIQNQLQLKPSSSYQQFKQRKYSQNTKGFLNNWWVKLCFDCTSTTSCLVKLYIVNIFYSLHKMLFGLNIHIWTLESFFWIKEDRKVLQIMPVQAQIMSLTFQNMKFSPVNLYSALQKMKIVPNSRLPCIKTNFLIILLNITRSGATIIVLTFNCFVLYFLGRLPLKKKCGCLPFLRILCFSF
jgi:hypothetical protein